MNRRQFLGAATGLTLAAQTRPRKPNIVFILADDLGYGDLGCYGQKRIQTPSLDRMASQGVRFTQAYSGATVCAPSRCGLMTGKHGGHATVRGNKKPEVGLRASEVTLPGLLKRAGYDTALFGKWGLGGPSTGSMPNQRGFDEFFGYLDQQHAHNYYPEHLWRNQEEFLLTANWFNRRKQYAPDLFTERALEYVARRRQNPYFLYLTYTLPHADNELGSATKNGMEVPSDEPYSRESWPQVEKNFAAMVTRLDRDIGRVLSAVDSNTLVIFASDNGPHKEGGHDPDYFQSRGPLRGIKRDLYEGGIRVPFIVRWPGQAKEGVVSDRVVAFWDMLPTLAEVAGLSPPRGIDGVSLAADLGDLRGRRPAGPRPTGEHPPLYWEFHEGGFFQAVRSKDWKGVRLKANVPIELYDLRTDIGETTNVAAKHPEVVTEIERIMRTSRVDSAEFPIKAD